jgi:hypothetical protein
MVQTQKLADRPGVYGNRRAAEWGTTVNERSWAALAPTKAVRTETGYVLAIRAAGHPQFLRA